jgi:hypothetical protein
MCQDGHLSFWLGKSIMSDGGIGMRYLTFLLTGLLALPFPPPLPAAPPSPALNLVIVEGEGAINNIRQRTAREAIVQVEDENHKPVAGAVVAFTLPSNGASGTFANNARTVTTITDNQGRASVRMRPNNVQGKYQMNVTASNAGQIATGVITQTNALLVGAAAGAAGVGISAKLIAIIAVAGAAAAGGTAYAVTRSNGNSSTTGPTATTINAGAGTVGPPR